MNDARKIVKSHRIVVEEQIQGASLAEIDFSIKPGQKPGIERKGKHTCKVTVPSIETPCCWYDNMPGELSKDGFPNEKSQIWVIPMRAEEVAIGEKNRC